MGVFELVFKSAHGRGKQPATRGDSYVPLLPCRLCHGIQAAVMYVFWSPCRLSHGNQTN